MIVSQAATIERVSEAMSLRALQLDVIASNVANRDTEGYQRMRVRFDSAMRRADAAMDPVLTLFRDQVLFLRHNLNARAIGSLETELADIERATANLIREMERSIEEASRFIDALA